ncbi:MAG: substrate-binding domain-containing protein, partial [Cyanobacteria bacterium P01_H01_bin.58]
MSSKNETPVLIAALLITVGLLGGGYWWFSRNGNFDLGSLLNLGNSPSSSPAPSTPSSTAPNAIPTGGNSVSSTLAEVQGIPSGLFSYGGSTTWAPIRGIVDPVLQQVQPAFKLRYVDPIGAPPGSGTGIAMLLANQLAFAQSSRPVKADERQQAESQGYSLKEIPVALEGIAIAVN